MVSKAQQIKEEDRAAKQALAQGKSPRDASIAGMVAGLMLMQKGAR